MRLHKEIKNLKRSLSDYVPTFWKLKGAFYSLKEVIKRASERLGLNDLYYSCRSLSSMVLCKISLHSFFIFFSDQAISR